jgi:peroxiredoxin
MKVKIVALVALSLAASLTSAEQHEIVWSDQERPIADQIRSIRKVPDDVRGSTTKALAMQIRELPATPNNLQLAMGLAGRATEGDFGRDTLQEVATTLELAIKEEAPKEQDPYTELASLVRYEHVNTALDSPQYSAAMARLESEDRERRRADFKLKDLKGRSWSLKDVHGKVVMLNFWATWCPPCRKEMPDLEALSQHFQSQGLVILGVSDDEPKKVRAFIQQQGISYPVLLDPSSKTNKSFHIEGIPKTFVYDREGKIVAQSIDMRTRKQFLEMLAEAGLK